MEWMTVKEVSALWGISGRRVQILCDTGKIKGAERLGNMWVIPKDTPRPLDGRTKTAKQEKRAHRRERFQTVPPNIVRNHEESTETKSNAFKRI
jgi:hypothetical protein